MSADEPQDSADHDNGADIVDKYLNVRRIRIPKNAQDKRGVPRGERYCSADSERHHARLQKKRVTHEHSDDGHFRQKCRTREEVGVLDEAQVEQKAEPRNNEKEEPRSHHGVGDGERLFLIVGNDVVGVEARVVNLRKGSRTDTEDGAYDVHEHEELVYRHTPNLAAIK